jgi:hypothetical protein
VIQEIFSRKEYREHLKNRRKRLGNFEDEAIDIETIIPERHQVIKQ